MGWIFSPTVCPAPSFCITQFKQLCDSESLINKAYQLEIRNMVSNIPTTVTTTIPPATMAISSFLSFIESYSLSLKCYTFCSVNWLCNSGLLPHQLLTSKILASAPCIRPIYLARCIVSVASRIPATTTRGSIQPAK